MEKARSLNPFSMESIDLEELYQQPQQGRIMVNDDVVLVIGGHIQHTRFLEEGKIYQIVEPRLVLAIKGNADICVNLQDCHLEKGSVMLLPSDTILEAKAISTDARVVAVVFREGMDIPEETILSASLEECDRILRMVYLTWDIMQLKPYRRKTIQHLLQSVVSNTRPRAVDTVQTAGRSELYPRAFHSFLCRTNARDTAPPVCHHQESQRPERHVLDQPGYGPGSENPPENQRCDGL